MKNNDVISNSVKPKTRRVFNLSDQELNTLYRSHMESYKASVEQMKLISTEQRVRTLEARSSRAKEYYAKCQEDFDQVMNSFIKE